MIDFDNWFRNIVASADLIASPNALRRAWLQGEKTITSAYDFSELAEQVLGDLDLEEQAKHFSKELEKRKALTEVAAFNRAFETVDQITKKNPTLADPSRLMKSSEWDALRVAAETLIKLPGVVPYRKQLPWS